MLNELCSKLHITTATFHAIRTSEHQTAFPPFLSNFFPSETHLFNNNQIHPRHQLSQLQLLRLVLMKRIVKLVQTSSILTQPVNLSVTFPALTSPQLTSKIPPFSFEFPALTPSKLSASFLDVCHMTSTNGQFKSKYQTSVSQCIESNQTGFPDPETQPLINRQPPPTTSSYSFGISDKSALRHLHHAHHTHYYQFPLFPNQNWGPQKSLDGMK